MNDFRMGVRAVFRRTFGLALALVIVFEEWGWEPLQRLMARLGRLPLVRQLEAAITRVPPGVALVLFFLPGLALLPVKIGALWLVAQGQPWAGLAVIVAAKVVGTAVVARLFALTRPALMRLTWFARGYERWSGWKGALIAWAQASALWSGLQAWRLRVRQSLRQWLRG